MGEERWREVQRLFEAALDMPADARAAFLERTCPDLAVRRDVEELLAADDQSGVVLTELGRAAAAVTRPGALTLKDEDLLEPSSVRPPPERPLVGELIAGKYRVERILGKGGMGVVVEATHVGLEERVAVKLLHRGILANEGAHTRFIREARTAAKVKSEHIARVQDVGELDDGSPYLVMELLEGRDLHAVLSEHGVLAVRDAALIVLQACEGLASAHRAGVVHRDIKPGNMFLTQRPDGTALVKLLDFGISKRLEHDADESALTRSGALLGSPSYMSPEQLRSSRDVDARTDVWSLGVVLYRALTGRLPFRAGSLADLCLDVLSKPYTPVRELRNDLPDGAEEIVARCLAKAREDRFADVAELASALAPLGGKLGIESAARVSRILGATAPLEVQRGPSDENDEQTTAPLARPASEGGGRAIVGLSAFMALALIAALGWWLSRDATDPTPSSAAPEESVTPEEPEEPEERVTFEESAAPSAIAASEASGVSPSVSASSSVRPRALPAPPPRDPYGSRK